MKQETITRIDALYNNRPGIEEEPYTIEWKEALNKRDGGWLQWNVISSHWEWHYIRYQTEYNGGRVGFSLVEIAENEDIPPQALAEAMATGDGAIWEEEMEVK